MSPTDFAVTSWRKSSRCESQHCVEVARSGDGVAIRDSTDPVRQIRFDRAGWQAFVVTLRTDSWSIR